MESGSSAGFVFPRGEVAAHNLVGEAAGAFEFELDVIGLLRVDVFEDELVEQVVVVRVSA